MMPYVLSTDLNGIDLLKGNEDVARCQSCNQPTDKWSEKIDTRSKSKFDFSISRDGFYMVNQKFKSMYDRSGFFGCEFIPLTSGEYVIMPARIVDFDIQRMLRGVERKCEVCGQYIRFGSLEKAYLSKEELPISDNEIARSRLETPLIDGCDFFIIIGDLVLKKFKENRIRRILPRDLL